MKIATKLAFGGILLYSIAFIYSKVDFCLSFPLFFAASCLFIEFFKKSINIHNQMPLKFVMNQVQFAPKSHSIFLNHKNSII
jgi:hypothetical protein